MANLLNIYFIGAFFYGGGEGRAMAADAFICVLSHERDEVALPPTADNAVARGVNDDGKFAESVLYWHGFFDGGGRQGVEMMWRPQRIRMRFCRASAMRRRLCRGRHCRKPWWIGEIGKHGRRRRRLLRQLHDVTKSN